MGKSRFKEILFSNKFDAVHDSKHKLGSVLFNEDYDIPKDNKRPQKPLAKLSGSL